MKLFMNPRVCVHVCVHVCVNMCVHVCVPVCVSEDNIWHHFSGSVHIVFETGSLLARNFSKQTSVPGQESPGTCLSSPPLFQNYKHAFLCLTFLAPIHGS